MAGDIRAPARCVRNDRAAGGDDDRPASGRRHAAASPAGREQGALDAFSGGVVAAVSHWWTSQLSRGHPVALACVVFAAADPQAAAAFYEDLLGGDRVASARPGRIELAWPSGAHIGFEPSGGDGTGIVAFEFEAAAIEPFRIGQTAITFGSGTTVTVGGPAERDGRALCAAHHFTDAGRVCYSPIPIARELEMGGADVGEHQHYRFSDSNGTEWGLRGAD